MLLSFPPGWNLKAPIGTMLVRVDVVMNTRPGAGGYAAIFEAADQKETVLLRGGIPDTNTEHMMKTLGVRIAEEIQGNRAVILTRSQVMYASLSTIFKPYKLIRLLGHSPLAVSDATRHAHVMAERALCRGEASEERLMMARFEPSREDFHNNQDTQTAHAALQKLIDTVGVSDLKSKNVQKAVQDVLDTTEEEVVAFHRDAIRKCTANDIPKPTREKEN
ncbi:hypothetical protein [Erythrobacter aureus]|uniref:Uncharacterized protein n=1 Tax=Erythrobacter aureus TaxID=2182384 RepID=A0A345YIL7_9SPHN|nr:hypothetical protein [Erythrobacter aureus]AXK43769.1 hypothetical protein DVR09_15040 [Erythrobacter aureus]